MHVNLRNFSAPLESRVRETSSLSSSTGVLRGHIDSKSGISLIFHVSPQSTFLDDILNLNVSSSETLQAAAKHKFLQISRPTA